MEFDAGAVRDRLIAWIRGWFEENGVGCTAVVGVSGGKDSSVVAALCARALGRERVLGVLMPNGVQSDIHVSRKLVEFLRIPWVEINIAESFDGMMRAVSGAISDVSEQTRINLAPRLRMAALYAVAQSRNGRVANTCNLSEDWVGYATRYGDGAGDFSPLSQLTVQEVKAVGRALGLPDEFVEKPPIDGLCGQTDEDKLGFTYATLDRYIRTGVCEDAVARLRIDLLHAQNRFKLLPMPYFPLRDVDWSRY